MTEQELREKIAKELCRQMGEDDWDTLPFERPGGKAGYLGLYKQQFYDLTKPILALIKEEMLEQFIDYLNQQYGGSKEKRQFIVDAIGILQSRLEKEEL